MGVFYHILDENGELPGRPGLMNRRWAAIMDVDKRIGEPLADQSAVAAINRPLRSGWSSLSMGIIGCTINRYPCLGDRYPKHPVSDLWYDVSQIASFMFGIIPFAQ